MSVYDKSGQTLSSVYSLSASIYKAYNIDGEVVFPDSTPDYSDYSYIQVWGSKDILAQGFDIYDDKVFWVSKSGDETVPSDCYMWNLSDGSQALDTPYITIYSGHGNNIAFDFPLLYASPAYPPSRAYVNTMSESFVATLTKTLTFNDGSTDCDCCLDDTNTRYMWTLGHTANSSDRSAPFRISKWDLDDLTDNGDGTYTPSLIQSVMIAQPANTYFFHGCRFHDGILWFMNGYSGSSTGCYVYGVNPTTGEYVYTIDCNTTAEPEGLAWYPDASAVGGYALYVGLAGGVLRKYTFGALT